MQIETSVNPETIRELYRTLVLLGADNGLLGTVGSWGDSLPEADVLANPKGWNAEAFREFKERIEHYEMPSRRPAYSRDVAARTAPEEPSHR